MSVVGPDGWFELDPHVEYSERADALYVVFDDETKVARTARLGDRRLVDVAADGRVLGVELLDVSTGIDYHDLPEAARVEQAIADAGLHFKVMT